MNSLLASLLGGLKPRPRNIFHPLFLPQKQLMLSLSAKSGSVFGASWLFYHSGLSDQVKNHPRWVHKYRQEVYYPSREYKSISRQFFATPSNFKKVKIVRNPYARAVSAYLHTLKRPELLHKDTAGLFNRTQYSFAEFIDTLERLEGKNIDPHYSPQTYDFERRAKWSYDWIIQLESCTGQLRELELAMNLGASPLEEFRESKHHSKRHTNSDKFVGHTPYRSGSIAHSDYPYFYNRELVQRVHKLFKDDFSRYGYSDELELPYSER